MAPSFRMAPTEVRCAEATLAIAVHTALIDFTAKRSPTNLLVSNGQVRSRSCVHGGARSGIRNATAACDTAADRWIFQSSREP